VGHKARDAAQALQKPGITYSAGNKERKIIGIQNI
jgi:hypothetical protein